MDLNTSEFFDGANILSVNIRRLAVCTMSGWLRSITEAINQRHGRVLGCNTG